MLHTIFNDKLRAVINDLGAEIKSVVRLEDGCEYIWQGDPKYWEDSAPVLFPICGRFFGGTYSYRGREYEMGIHGFAAAMTYEVSAKSENAITFSIRDNDVTRAQYPFAFTFSVTYRLEGEVLVCDVSFSNEGEEIMPATFGAHPGFRVPFAGNCRFEDYYLEFDERCDPNQLLITPNGFYSGRQVALPLEEGKKLRMHHELFKSDGIFMSRMADAVTLKSDLDPRGVTLTYRGYPYLGIWQEYGEGMPFLCIEPWYGMAAYDGEHADLEEKCDMFRLLPGERRDLTYSIQFH